MENRWLECSAFKAAPTVADVIVVTPLDLTRYSSAKGPTTELRIRILKKPVWEEPNPVYSDIASNRIQRTRMELWLTGAQTSSRENRGKCGARIVIQPG